MPRISNPAGRGRSLPDPRRQKSQLETELRRARHRIVTLQAHCRWLLAQPGGDDVPSRLARRKQIEKFLDRLAD